MGVLQYADGLHFVCYCRVVWLAWFGCRGVWLVWFGVADRVVYEVRSGWVVAGYCFFIVVFRMPVISKI